MTPVIQITGVKKVYSMGTNEVFALRGLDLSVERGEMIALSVADSGTGMDEDTLTRAFEPFFTTKMTGKGTGLGLSQVYGFASQSGGEVRIDSRPNHGTTVTLMLPRRGSVREKASGKKGKDLERGRTGRILLVEDNEEVGQFAAQLLGELGHDIARVQSGEHKSADIIAQPVRADVQRRRTVALDSRRLRRRCVF